MWICVGGVGCSCAAEILSSKSLWFHGSDFSLNTVLQILSESSSLENSYQHRKTENKENVLQNENKYSSCINWAHPVQASDYGVSVTARSRSTDFHRLVDIPSRRRLRSASSLQLDVPRTHRRTVDDWAFTATGRSDALEQSATRHYWLCVTDVILPETENFFVFYIISMTTLFFLVVLEVFTWATLSMYVLYTAALTSDTLVSWKVDIWKSATTFLDDR